MVSSPHGKRSAVRSRPRTPLAVVVLGVIAGAFVALPVVGIIARAAWDRAPNVLASSGTLTALRLSVVVATYVATRAAAKGSTRVSAARARLSALNTAVSPVPCERAAFGAR